MMRRSMALVLLAALALSAAGCAERVVSAAPADDKPAANTVTAEGVGKRSTAPDRARMDFAVSARDTDSKTALDQASAKSRTLIGALRAAGIAKADLQTTDVSVYPDRSASGRVIAYNASIGVRAELKDIADLGKVIEAASRAGSTDFGGPSFYLSDDNAANDDAIKAAVADARRRAEIMASAAGKRVGAVLAIGEADTAVTPLYDTFGARSAEMAKAVPIEAGQLDASARVRVTFVLQ